MDESYYILHPNQAKDSNMEASVLSRQLDLVWEMSKELQCPMFDNLIIGIDNTAREGKNQFFLLFCAFLEAKHCFRNVQVEFLPSRHSQNYQDLCFSVVSGQLPQALRLASSKEFEHLFRPHRR